MREGGRFREWVGGEVEWEHRQGWDGDEEWRKGGGRNGAKELSKVKDESLISLTWKLTMERKRDGSHPHKVLESPAYPVR